MYIICHFLQELPEGSDLTYLDRGRLEEEYRKLKELKKKAEYYAVKAKQTAQRLSAENFKLKEDLSRERHHNELTRKNMIREMEQKMDKSATALDRADARLEVFEQEVTARALQLIRRMPAPAMASQLSRGEINGHIITRAYFLTLPIVTRAAYSTPPEAPIGNAGNAGNTVTFFTFTMAWKCFCYISEVSGLIHKYNNRMII